MTGAFRFHSFVTLAGMLVVLVWSTLLVCASTGRAAHLHTVSSQDSFAPNSCLALRDGHPVVPCPLDGACRHHPASLKAGLAPGLGPLSRGKGPRGHQIATLLLPFSFLRASWLSSPVDRMNGVRLRDGAFPPTDFSLRGVLTIVLRR